MFNDPDTINVLSFGLQTLYQTKANTATYSGHYARLQEEEPTSSSHKDFTVPVVYTNLLDFTSGQVVEVFTYLLRVFGGQRILLLPEAKAESTTLQPKRSSYLVT